MYCRDSNSPSESIYGTIVFVECTRKILSILHEELQNVESRKSWMCASIVPLLYKDKLTLHLQVIQSKHTYTYTQCHSAAVWQRVCIWERLANVATKWLDLHTINSTSNIWYRHACITSKLPIWPFLKTYKIHNTKQLSSLTQIKNKVKSQEKQFKYKIQTRTANTYRYMDIYDLHVSNQNIYCSLGVFVITPENNCTRTVLFCFVYSSRVVWWGSCYPCKIVWLL